MVKREIGWRQVDLLATILIFAAGSALHFAYSWFGAWPPVAIFAAVNESVWEHLKIAFWPALLWAALQLRLGRPRDDGYWAARGIGLFAISIAIIIVFYGYTAFLGDNLLLLDIATFAMAILIGQSISNLALSAVRRSPGLRIVGLAALFAQIAAFSAFSYMPPHLILFEDGRNGLYGLSAYEGPSHPARDY
jgi:hypothetical protein